MTRTSREWLRLAAVPLAVAAVFAVPATASATCRNGALDWPTCTPTTTVPPTTSAPSTTSPPPTTTVAAPPSSEAPTTSPAPTPTTVVETAPPPTFPPDSAPAIPPTTIAATALPPVAAAPAPSTTSVVGVPGPTLPETGTPTDGLVAAALGFLAFGLAAVGVSRMAKRP